WSGRHFWGVSYGGVNACSESRPKDVPGAGPSAVLSSSEKQVVKEALAALCGHRQADVRVRRRIQDPVRHPGPGRRITPLPPHQIKLPIITKKTHHHTNPTPTPTNPKLHQPPKPTNQIKKQITPHNPPPTSQKKPPIIQ
ncbi:unnamed protein product, partial [Tetraodon nigroviridis]